MPVYDYRCNQCGQASSLFYKRYQDYDEATPTCPECGSADMTRLISRVAIPSTARDYAHLSSGEMLSVLESGDPRAVGEMFHQVGQSEAETLRQAEAIKTTKQAAAPPPPANSSSSE